MENRLHLHHTFATQVAREARAIFENMNIMDAFSETGQDADEKPKSNRGEGEKRVDEAEKNAGKTGNEAGGILDTKEEQEEDAEKIKERLNAALARAREAIKSPMDQLPIGAILKSEETKFVTKDKLDVINNFVTDRTAASKFDRTAQAGIDSSDNIVVMETNAINAVKKIGRGIGYDISKLEDGKDGELTRADGRIVEVKGGVATIELEEFMPTGSPDLKTQADAVEKCINGWILQLGTEIDVDMIQKEYDAKIGQDKNNGEFEVKSEQGEWKEDDSTRQCKTMIETFMASIDNSIGGEDFAAFKQTVVGRFLEKVSVKKDSANTDILLCATPEMEREFKQFHIAWSLWGMGERLPVRERMEGEKGKETLAELGMVITPQKLQSYLDGMQLRLTGDVREGAKTEGGIMGPNATGDSKLDQLARSFEGKSVIEGPDATAFVNRFRPPDRQIESPLPLKITVQKSEKDPNVLHYEAIDKNTTQKIAEIDVRVGNNGKLSGNVKSFEDAMREWLRDKVPLHPDDVRIVREDFELPIDANISRGKIAIDESNTKKVLNKMAEILDVKDARFPDNVKAIIVPSDGLEDGNLTFVFYSAGGDPGDPLAAISCTLKNNKIEIDRNEFEKAFR